MASFVPLSNLTATDFKQASGRPQHSLEPICFLGLCRLRPVASYHWLFFYWCCCGVLRVHTPSLAEVTIYVACSVCALDRELFPDVSTHPSMDGLATDR